MSYISIEKFLAKM